MAASSVVVADPPPRRLGWPALLALWGVPAIVSALQIYAGYALRGEGPREWPYAAVLGGSWLLWAPLTPLVLGAAARWPVAVRGADGAWRLHGPALWRHALAGTALSLVQSTIVAAALVGVQRLVAPAEMARMSFAMMAAGAVLSRLVTGQLTYAAIVAVAIAADSLGRLGAEEVRAARMSEQLATARLGALKMQLHPHFLFNTLHAVTVLIREDPPAAARMVTRLGDLLRLTLARAERAEVALDDELALVRLYLDIEAVRFADRLVVTYDVADDVRAARVPDLALQPLVENAIGHGIAPRRDAGRLVIRAYRRATADDLPEAPAPPGGWLVLEVEDDGPGPNAPPVAGVARASTRGIGLASTRERLAALHGAARSACVLHALPERGCLARLTLPYLPLAEAHDVAA